MNSNKLYKLLAFITAILCGVAFIFLSNAGNALAAYPGTTRLDNLDDARVSDVYFYDDYNYYANAEYKVLNSNACEVVEGICWTAYGFTQGKEFKVTSGRNWDLFEVTFKNVGYYYKNGHNVNLKFYLNYSDRASNEAGKRTIFDYAHGDGATKNAATLDSANCDTYLIYTLTLYDATTNQPLPDDVNVCYEYNDVDIPSTTSPETIAAWNDQFYDAYIYANSSVNVTTIDDNGTKKTGYQGTQPNDDDYSPLTTVIYHAKNNAMFRWAGNGGCGTALGIRALSPGYPKITSPVKSLTSLDTVRRGDSVSYKIAQNFPYLNTTSSNKPSSLVIEDTLDNALDVSGVSASTVSVKQKRNGSMVDVSSNWTFTKSGQTVKFTAKDTSGTNCVDDFEFSLSGIKVKTNYTFAGYAKTSDDKCWVVPNKAKTTAVGPSTGTVVQNSNTVNVNVKRPVNISYKIVDKYSPDNPPSVPTVPASKYYIGDKYSPAGGLTDSTDYYYFDGWYTDKDCTKQYNGGTLSEENFVLYGRWKPKPIFSITKEVSKPQYNINEKAHFKIIVKQTVDGAFGVITDFYDGIDGTCSIAPQSLDAQKQKSLTEAGGSIVQDSISIKRIDGSSFDNWHVDFTKDQLGNQVMAIGTGGSIFGYNDGLIIEYDVQLGNTKSTDLQGNSYTNLASMRCSSAPRNEQFKEATATFSVRTPKLVSAKTPDKNLVNAGDTVTYTLSTSQTVEDAKAYNVHLRDAIPQELLDLGGTVDLSGIKVEFPAGASSAGFSPTMTGNVLDISTTATLETNETITAKVPIKFGKRTNAMAGKSFQNQLTAIADNVSSDLVNATVSVTNPVMSIDKSSEKTKVNTSESNKYTLEVINTTDNSLAYGSKVVDALSQDAIDAGAYIDESSITVSDNSDGSGAAFVNGYKIFPSRASNGKITGFEVDLPNDTGQSKAQKWYVNYVVIAGNTGSTGLYDTSINNKATSCCANGTSTAQDTNKVELYTPTLKIVKETSSATANIGEDIGYKITVEQLVQGAVAWNVGVRDALDADFVKNGAAYKRDTLRVYDATGVDKTSTCKIIYDNDGTGFTISSPISLSFRQKMSVTYSVSCGNSTNTGLQGKEWKNIATAGADNTVSEVRDDANVTVRTPALSASKTVDKELIDCGDKVVYTLTAKQTVSGAKAYNVVFTDEIPFDAINEGSVVDTSNITVKLNGSQIMPKSVKLENTTLRIETGATLDGMSTLTAEVPMTIGTRNGALNGKTLRNILTVSSDNAQPATSGADVKISVTQPELAKNADKKSVNLGDTNTYTLRVGNKSDNGGKAYDIKISDSLNSNSAANGAYILDTPVVTNDAGKNVTDQFTFAWTNKTAAGNTAFALHTDGPLASNEHYNVSYQVKNGNVDSVGLYDSGINNEAVVQFGSGTSTAKSVRDDEDVKAIKPALSIEKSSDKSSTNIGEDVAYTVTAKQTVSGSVAINPVISDRLQSGFAAAGGKYISDSVRMTNAAGTDVTNKCSVKWVNGNTGFDVTYNGSLGSDDLLHIAYKVCYGATTSVGLQGHSWTNTVSMSSPNATDDVTGTATVAVLKPSLSAQKSVDKQYANVDDMIAYTLTASNNGESGSVAYNVVFNDAFPSEFFSAGAKIDEGAISVVDDNGKAVSKQVSMNGSTLIIRTSSSLPSGSSIKAIVPVKLGGKASSDLCGNAYKNSLHVQSDNAGTADAEAIVNIYKPDLSISKESSKSIVNTSDRIDYAIKVKNNKAGSIAWRTYVSDELSADTVLSGAFIDKSTLTVRDTNGMDVTSKASVSWKQSDSGKAIGLTATMNDSFAFSGGETFTVTYQVVAGSTDSTKLLDTGISNSVKCGSSNGLDGGHDENKVMLYTPVLKITKESDKKMLNTGDEAEYTLTVEQLTDGAKAWNARITDSLDDKAFDAGAFIIPDSLSVIDGNGNDITKADTTKISFVGKASGNASEKIDQASGFEARTAAIVEYGKPVIVKYIVRFGGDESIDLAGMDVTNIAKADSDNNIWEATDNETVSVYKPALAVEKESDASSISQGDEANYLVTMTQQVDGAVAHNVGLVDVMPYVGEASDLSTDQIRDSVEFRIDGDKVNLERSDATSATDTTSGEASKTGSDTSTSSGSNNNDESDDLSENDSNNQSARVNVETVTISADDFAGMFGNESSTNIGDSASGSDTDRDGASNDGIASSDKVSIDKTNESSDTNTENNNENVDEQDSDGVSKLNKYIADNKAFGTAYVDDIANTAKENGKQIQLIVITVDTNLDLAYGSKATMNYSVLFGNVPQQTMMNSVIAHAGNAEMAYADTKFPIVTPVLAIDKSVDATNPMKPSYMVRVRQTVDGANAKQVSIVDMLDDDAIKAGFFIDDGITVKNSLGDDVTDKCTIQPKCDSLLFGKIIGYEISYQNVMRGGDELVIQYTGDSSKLGYGITTIKNTATASAWNVVDDVSADASYDYDGGVAAEIEQTGDNNAWIIIAAIAGLASISTAAATRTKRRHEHGKL